MRRPLSTPVGSRPACREDRPASALPGRQARRGYFRRLIAEPLEPRHLLSGLLPYLPPTRFLYSDQGALSPPRQLPPYEAALTFLHERAAQLGLAPGDFDQPLVTSQYTDADTGLTHLYLRQQVGGLEVAAADFNVTLDRQGRVLTVGGGFVPGLAKTLGATPLAPELDPAAALRLAAQQLGVELASEPLIVDQGPGPAQPHTLVAPDVSVDKIPARLHYVPTGDESALLAWQLIVRTPDGQNWFDLSVPATTAGYRDFGEIVALHDWVSHASYRVVPPPTESPEDGSFVIRTDGADPVASPFGWHDTNGLAGPEFTDTRGNNVDAHLDRNGDNVADATPPRPDGGAALDFTQFQFNPALAPSAPQNQTAAVVNLFYVNNFLHDVHYKYGFTEAAGNFQINNYGRGGLGNDAVQADAQDNASGGSANNANFATPPDGFAPRMQMFEFTATNPRRDSDLDNGVIIHEYGHGVSNRLTGGPANSNALSALQSGGLGEGWSDWHALMLLQRPTDLPTTGLGLGTYVLGQPPTGLGIRRQRYSFDLTINPITFDAFGIGAGKSTEVHDTGEIWASALWDLNWLLIAKHGYDADLHTGYTGSGPGGAGNKLALRLAMDALKLQPANPSFVQARDAILAADVALTGGANRCEVWTAFARRGLGQGAATPGASSSSLTTSFTVPAGVCGLAVLSTVPAAGSAVSSVPTEFVVNFSDPIVAESLQPGDLLVDGAPASAVTLPTATQALFRFDTPPFAAQGAHTLALAAGAVLRASDNSPLQAYSGQIRYDTTPLAVTGTSPAAGGVLTLPAPLNYEATFNEPIDPASLQASDLLLTGVPGASVASVTLLPGGLTARFTMSGLASEGTLTATIPSGAIADTVGNPNPASFSVSLYVDATTTAMPPLAPRAPLGSLVYEGSAAGILAPAGDVDRFTLALDTGQTLAVVVTPAASTLQPRVELRDSAGGLIAAASAAALGTPALLPAVPIAATGPYTLIVSGAAGSGDYSVQLVLNAARESEGLGGPGNDLAAAAQDLAPAAIAAGGGSRMAVRGATGTGALLATENFETGTLPAAITTYSSTGFGRIRVLPPAGSGNTSGFALLLDSSSDGNYVLNEAIYTVNLSGLDQAALSFSYVRFNDESDPLPLDFTGHADGDGVAISDDGIRWRTILNAPTNTSWTTTSIDLAAAAAAAGMSLGPNFKIKFQQYDNFSFPTDGRAYDNIQLALPDLVDTYRLTLAAGDTLSIAIEVAGGTLTTQLRDSAGALWASAVSGPANADQVLANVRIPQAGDYFLVLTGDHSGIDYTVVAARNADFNLEPNDQPAQAQPLLSRQLGSDQWVLGHIGSLGDAVDLYQVRLAAGGQLTAQTALPASGPGEFVNLLDPRLRLLDAQGTVLAADDNRADGRNALLSYTHAGPQAATFFVEVAASGAGAAGEYLLRVGGNLPQPPAFQVQSTTPVNGAVLTASPAAFTVELNAPYLASTVQAADLIIDGQPATAVELVDGDTLRFVLGRVLEPGFHLVNLFVGSVLSVHETPLAEFAATFQIDVTPPRVISMVPPPGAVVAAGPLTVQVTFSEPMKVANLSADDFTLTGVHRGATYPAAGLSFDAAGAVLSLAFSNLPEDAYTLALASSASAFADAAGNLLDGELGGSLPSGNGAAGGDFSAAFFGDRSDSSFPAPLAARPPLGSRIYEGASSGAVAPASDSDGFSLTLDASQTLAAHLRPLVPTLAASISLVDGGGAVLASAQAAGPGQNVLLAPTAIVPAGNYTLRVGATGTTGLYALDVTLNAALESEGHLAGSANNSVAEAQPIQTSLTVEPTTAPVARRAVLGRTDSGGSYTASAAAPTFLDISSTGNRSLRAVGDDAADTLSAAQLGGFVFPFFGTNYSSVSFNTNGLVTFGGESSDYSNTDLATSPALAAIAPFWDDLVLDGSGTGAATRGIFWQLLGDSPATARLVIQWNNALQLGGLTPLTFQVVLSADGSIQFNYGNTFNSTIVAGATVGAKAAGNNNPARILVSYNQPAGPLVGPGLSTRIAMPAVGADYYAVALGAGESAAWLLTPLGSGGLELEIRAADNSLLAASVAGPTNVERAITGFIAPTTGTYYARVSGAANVAYALVVTRNADFNLEPNDQPAQAQPLLSRQLGSDQWVLGHIGSLGDAVDLYQVRLAAGGQLTAQTALPASGPGEFVNLLDPRLRLLDAQGTVLAADDNRADGRNALLSYTHAGPQAATFFVEVAASGAGAAGEYLLRVGGNLPQPPAFQVQSTTPVHGAVLTASPAAFTVELNAPYLASTVQAADLIIDGQPATAVEFVTNTRLRFTLPELTSGGHTVSLAAGSLQSASGDLLAPFTAGFTIDTHPPRVLATTPAPTSLVPGGPLALQIIFSKPMQAALFSSDDFSLVGLLRNTTYVAVGGGYDPTTSILTLNFPSLPEDNYRLTLRSGAAAFTDMAGALLDGEFSGSFPSGDSTAGGDFVLAFSVDATSAPLAAPFVAVQPAGSLIYRASLAAALHTAADTDTWTIGIDAGQTLSLLISSGAGLQPALTLRDPSGNILTTTTAPAPGAAALVQTAAITTAGVYSVTVEAAGGAAQLYTLEAVLNAALEQEPTGGPRNDTALAAEDLEPSAIALGLGASRLAALGTLEGGSDTYRFSLAAGERVTLAAAALAPGSLGLELLTSSGVLLAMGGLGANAARVINDFVAPEPGNYLVRLLGGANVPYSLLVTRSGRFDVETHDSFHAAAALGAGDVVALGHVEAGDDWYSIQVAGTGGSLHLETRTPADGALAFANTLNPRLELFGPAGTLVAAGTLLADGRNETLTWQPLASGSYRVRISGEGGTSGEYILLVNLGPSLAPLAPLAAALEGQLLELSGEVLDVNPLQPLIVTIDWGPGQGTTVLGLAPGMTTFSAAHSYPDNGPPAAAQFPITVTVANRFGQSATAATIIRVNNAPPDLVLDATEPVVEGGLAELRGTILDAPLDTFTLTIDWGDPSSPGNVETIDLQAPPPHVTWDAQTRSFSATHRYLDNGPPGAAVGTFTIQVQVADDDGGQAATQAAVAVNNVPPEVAQVALSDQRREGDLVRAAATATDAAGLLDPLQYQWRVFKEDADVALATGDGAEFAFTPDNDGTYRLELTVLDDDGGSTTLEQAFDIANVPPLPLDKSAATAEDTPANVTLAAQDVAADSLSWSVVAAPRQGTLAGQPPHLTYVPRADFHGVDSFTYRAQDEHAASAEAATVLITITPVNDAPRFLSGPGQRVSDDSPPQAVPWASALDAGAPDEAAQELWFEVTSDNPRLFLVPPAIDAAGQLTYTVAPNARGVAMVEVRLRDSGGVAGGGSDTSAPIRFPIEVAKSFPWHNTRHPLDVNDSGGPQPVSPLDALVIFNLLNAATGPGNLSVSPTAEVGRPYFYDTSKDNHVSPLDALLVINWLNSAALQSAGAAGENAPAAAVDQVFQTLGQHSTPATDLAALLAVLDFPETPSRRRR